MRNLLKNFSKKSLIRLLSILILINLAVFIWVGLSINQPDSNIHKSVAVITPTIDRVIPNHAPSFNTKEPDDTILTPTLAATTGLQFSPEIGFTSTLEPKPQAAPVETSQPNNPSLNDTNPDGLLILSIADGNFIHLFAYNPNNFPFKRITDGVWDDIHPAISPDGTRIAYSSNKNGFWDLYVLDLSNGLSNQITHSQAYDGSPTWSPDGEWIAFESYVDNNLEILILNINDTSLAPVNLSENQAADFSPAWSPQGRKVAFISTRSGEEEVWLADLDKADNRAENMSRSPTTREKNLSWSPDGRYLTWSSQNTTFSTLIALDTLTQKQDVYTIGTGGQSAWNPSGTSLFTVIENPNQTLFCAYKVSTSTLSVPLTPLSGTVFGLDWKSGKLPSLLATFNFPPEADVFPRPAWESKLSVNPLPPSGRFGMVKLENTTAPYGYLHDAADESYIMLRRQISKEAGWDFLAQLDNAFIPITQPTTPGMSEDWLYTGRAFQVSSLPVSAGWMVIAREDYNGEVYWRIYIKTLMQDGSQGRPVTQFSWNLDARYQEKPRAYEQGGEIGPIPEGYWIDFTEIASRFGWERQSALLNWRTFYPGARYSTFIFREHLDWNLAMAEIYPPEALTTTNQISLHR